ncbi:Proteasome subunit beta precursor [Actinomadura rubteroloni]|uniref:Proteasome subunit beta n=1 Tax=Actinomadura rubteroloni TaxID=1926885 RepID=A0A2P4UB85_9ACTN|nr:proteasome subunit beta [Actinomadura rubteroloni]POM22315.1 Proteasome subunit beta precursor [Actinomadura rubteroloni]
MNGWADDQGLSPELFEPGTPSFVDFLRQRAPELLPVNRVRPQDRLDLPHGTTVLALTFPGGVMMAGDRRATQGNVIAYRELDKVQRADEFSVVAFAGTVGLALEMVRLFQVELEHYEKMETVPLSLPGKARRLGAVIQANLAQALQGLAVVPLFAGYDADRGEAHIYTYDITGAPQRARGFHADGSGSPFAEGSLKKLYRPDLSVEDAARVAVEALYDAADDDSATGGPDRSRRIYPSISVVTADGYRALPETEIAAVVDTVVEERMARPGGPVAPLR